MGHSVSTLLEIDQRLRRGLVPSIDGKLINATNINAALLNLEILRWHDAESVVLEMDTIRTENNRKLQAQREEIASLKKNVNELENKIKTLNEDHVDLSNECSAMNTAFEQIDQLLNNKRRKTVPPVIESGAFVDPSRSQGSQTTLVYEQDGGDDIDNASVGSFTVSSLEGAGHGLGKHDLKEIFSKEAEEAVESKAEGAVLE